MRVFTWIDAAFDLTDIPDLQLMETAGWLVEEHEDYIVVASERVEGGDFRQFTTIPRESLIDYYEDLPF